MTPQTLLELIDCAQLTHAVNHPLPDRGGLFLVGPPESFRTTILDLALKPYEDALVLSDLNVQQLSKLRGDFSRGRYNTLAFREFSKLFERDPRTASNLLGHLRALTGEGFKTTSFEDPRMGSTVSRVMLVGAMTEDFYHRQFSTWEADGFMRRFIWVIFNLKGMHKATEAILNKKLLQFDGIARRYPGQREIPYFLEEKDQHAIRAMLKEQRGATIPALLLSKIFCVLKWKYPKELEKPWQVLN